MVARLQEHPKWRNLTDLSVGPQCWAPWLHVLTQQVSHCTCRPTLGDSGKEWLKRWVFKCFLKTNIDDADVTFSGRVFLSRAAATGKARSPMVERWVRGTTKAMMSMQSGDADEPRVLSAYCHSLEGATLFSETQIDREFVISFLEY